MSHEDTLLNKNVFKVLLSTEHNNNNNNNNNNSNNNCLQMYLVTWICNNL